MQAAASAIWAGKNPKSLGVIYPFLIAYLGFRPYSEVGLSMEICRRLEGRGLDCIPLCGDEAEIGLNRGERIVLTVIFTGFDATVAAMQHAAELGKNLNPLIRVLVAQSVPYSLPLERPPIDPEFRVRQLSGWCENQTAEIFFDVRLGRDRQVCLETALVPQSVVLIGESQKHWWRTPEQRLARRLSMRGHRVILLRRT